ncbi:mitochondrial carrier domain-containing protein [Russula compacta]|nr:mitochondrial carrier domain-containing protein [Russula compacta]
MQSDVPSEQATARKTTTRSPVSAASPAVENLKSFVAGGFGGVSVVLVGHPFDLTKTRLQTAPAGTYTGGFDVVRKILVRDGPTGLYRGVVPPLLGVTPIFAVSFWVLFHKQCAYDASKRLIRALSSNRTDSALSTYELAAAGFLSAIPTALVSAPVERAKVLLQVQGQGGSSAQYKGVFDVIGHLYKEGGIRSIYRGTFATLVRDGPGSAAYFAAYEVTKKALAPANASSSDLNIGQVILAGGLAGVAMWAIAIPPDVLKSRLQSAPTGTYSGIVDCARKTIATGGVKALWKGFGPAMARCCQAFPANAATFLGVEASRKKGTTRSRGSILFYPHPHYSRIQDPHPRTEMARSSLDSATTSAFTTKKKIKRYSRSLSASEIAKNAKTFDTWCSYQRCEEVAFSDLPDAFRDFVDSVFNTHGCLPAEWLDKSSKFYRRMKATSSPEFMTFMNKAQEECPLLFSRAVPARSNCRLLDELKVVFLSWEHLQRMRSESKDKASEADFVSNVYEGLRSSAFRESTYKAKWPIGLPQPPAHRQIPTQSIRILNAKSVVPDGAVFVPEKAIQKLSLAAESAFKQLRRSGLAGSAARGEESFACQSTPCVQLPRTPGFQFASSFWEDKKPVHCMLEDAYRQNRMATAAAVRHLHSLHVKAPVFGLVWSDGSVRAHVDCDDGYEEESRAHEWNLNSPANIIEVFLLLKNIDHWTVNGFLKCVEVGIDNLVDSVLLKGCLYQSWKRVGTFKPPRAKEAHGTENSSSQPPAQPTVARNTRSRRRQVRQS